MTLITLELAGVEFHCTEVLEISRPKDVWQAIVRAARSSQEWGDDRLSVFDGDGGNLNSSAPLGELRDIGPGH